MQRLRSKKQIHHARDENGGKYGVRRWTLILRIWVKFASSAHGGRRHVQAGDRNLTDLLPVINWKLNAKKKIRKKLIASAVVHRFSGRGRSGAIVLKNGFDEIAGRLLVVGLQFA